MIQQNCNKTYSISDNILTIRWSDSLFNLYLLKDENQNQVKHFCKKYNLSVVDNDYFQSLPEKGGMDSFFSISLRKIEYEYNNMMLILNSKMISQILMET
ncbi:unnamed protein product [Paramecium octaurelia]|uniref:Uncharacterized protein n=1 Tax=Paramecium octaurelia TaxID=43137 RepID=A0A8S1THV1_PAROT|nr:unnamed protein product [Paramecium octaurelia]